MNLKINNIIVKEVDTYLINKLYKDVHFLIEKLRAGLYPKVKGKNDKGQYIIDYFVLDGHTMSLLMEFLLRQKEEIADKLINELKQCEIYEEEKLIIGEKNDTNEK